MKKARNGMSRSKPCHDHSADFFSGGTSVLACSLGQVAPVVRTRSPRKRHLPMEPTFTPWETVGYQRGSRCQGHDNLFRQRPGNIVTPDLLWLIYCGIALG